MTNEKTTPPIHSDPANGGKYADLQMQMEHRGPYSDPVGEENSYVKKPVKVQAMQWTGDNVHALLFWAGTYHNAGSFIRHLVVDDSGKQLTVNTEEGALSADIGDWIIKGYTKERGNHFWINKPDYFESAYEKPPTQQTGRTYTEGEVNLIGEFAFFKPTPYYKSNEFGSWWYFNGNRYTTSDFIDKLKEHSKP